MVIEEPENPIDFPVKMAAFEFLAFPDQFQTIGQFYQALSDALDESMFISDASRQVKGFGLPVITGADPATSLANARAAIRVIMQQGEGTPTSPLQAAQGEPAHYYLFAGIFHGKKLAPDSSVPEGYSYSGANVTIDPKGVFPLLPDPTVASYAPGSPAFQANLSFNSAYSALLDKLHDVFNGHPSDLGSTLGLMTQLRMIAAGDGSGGTPMVRIPVTSGGQSFNASPTYTYVPPAQRSA